MKPEKPVSAMPENWEPPVPAWSAMPRADKTTIAYLSAQNSDRSLAQEGLSRIQAFLTTEGGPFHVDFAISSMGAAPTDAFAIAYFNGPTHFDAWAQASGFDAWWKSDARLSDACGYWQERLTLPAQRMESLHSSMAPDGHAHGVDLKGPVREHNYWGGMRDRIALSKDDWLDTPITDTLARRSTGPGTRIVVNAPLNLCIIRSGQDLTDASAEERAVYSEVVEPNLAAGMTFLAEQGLEIGCAASRYAVEITSDGTPLARTFGNCLFVSMKHLEDWAKSHPTHLSIFGSFFKLLKARDNKISLRLWHEVVVLPSGEQHFEYINCHPGTGISGLFQ
ncbi:aldoxime dehydratase [Rhizobium sp. SG_E_25_P2]|uniref:phenylacetaldoxime dehydratase family protein n=1 Tax=Rhizobium sp. SG_E_25_P2 TaxID=2879942 RepID=UPI00247663DC|nr:phenylacetaldoxime dehydratase family protein [Rhizobium sp. SG_E_25_P2]MDH6267224.1 aldoxime dehydratase [Rhizobium sp. SG_E_25_P2]